MRYMELLQSVLTYFCTAGIVAIITYFARISRRITVLEEHDKEQIKAVDKIGNLTEKLTRMDTKLDLLLEGKIKND